MERQSTSKLYRALIAVVAFFVLCTSAILFASCGTDPRECKHEHLDDSDVVAVQLATCGTRGTVTYECSDCGAEVTVIGTLATGAHTPDANGKCTVCGLDVASDGITLKDVKDLLAEVASKVDKQQSAIVEALTEKNFTIPALDAKLEKILNSVQGLGDLEIEGFDPSEFEDILADTIADKESATLAEVITALYKQVHRLYTDYASTSTSASSLYKLLVAKDAEGEDHVHNWILKLIDEGKSCTDPHSYVWGCAFCGAEKDSDKFTVQAVGHATDFKYALTYDGADKDQHYLAATCISGARVEGHCANCGEWTGEWNEVGKPTFQHHYVLEEERKTPSAGDACVVSQKVYHCETCGGAYVEEGKGLGHQYYYKMVNGKKVALSEEEKTQILTGYYGKTKVEAGLTEDEKGIALQPYLNIVYSAEPTCVDPGLVVVECLECGVRYSYTTGLGEPKGHTFTVKEGVAHTCTMDGYATYAYCADCGYFFFYDGTDTLQTEVEKKVGKYSRNYIRNADNQVIYYDSSKLSGTSVPEATPAADADKALSDLYAVITAKDAAPGHTFVPVYINIEKCVTAQQYVLVCSTCFGTYNAAGQKTESFSQLTTTTENDTSKLFYKKSGTTTADDKYWISGLTGNPVADKTLAVGTDGNGGKVADIGKKAVKDDPAKNPVNGASVTTSDLTAEWNALKTADDVTKFAWLAAHGYLFRDTRDNGLLPSITRKDVTEGNTKWYDDKGELTKAAKTTINGYLAKLKAANVTVDSLYTECNVLGTWVPATTGSSPVAAHCTPVHYADVVEGHHFNERILTVMGGCTMYERHVFFCEECGQNVLTDTEDTVATAGDGPHTVVGDTDVVCAGYDGTNVKAPEGFKTDLQLAWEAVKASMDPSAPFLWLAEHGYLNDLRDDMSDPFDAETEMMDLMARATVILLGKDIRDCIQLPPDALDPLFTGMNVLNEFTEDVVYKNTDAMEALSGDGEGPAGGLVIDPTTGSYTYDTAPLGHKFNAITYISEVESCDTPADYVYVCSVCGKTSGSSLGKLSYSSGKNTVATGLNQVAKASQKFVSDKAVFEASVPEARRTEDAEKKIEFETSDFDKLWLAVPEADEEAQFTWLLEKGYLNGVIDKFFMDGYKDAEGVQHGGFLAAALKKAQEEDPLAAVDTTMYTAARETVYVKEGNTLTLTLKTDYRDDVLALAKQLLGTAYDDLTAYYLNSGDVEVPDEAANKTLNAAKVTVPASGHLFSRENNSPIDLNRDPLCLDFASDELTQSFKDGKIVYWNADKQVAGSATKGGWDEVTGAKRFTFNMLPQKIQDAVNKYGVLGACNRENCPLHKGGSGADGAWTAVDYEELTVEGNPFGYVIATDHQTSYEKYAADNNGYPTKTLETKPNEDNEIVHVYYNNNKVDFYNNETKAAAYLPEGKTWTGATEATQTEKEAAAKAAQEHDFLNLTTLQKIWNTLFIPDSWLNDASATAETIKAHKDAYPTITFDEELMKDGKVDLGKLAKAFDAQNATLLWKGTDLATITSVWRPLGDGMVPSCWVSLRCHWYHYTSGDPQVDEAKGFDGKSCANGQYRDAETGDYENEQDKESVALYPANPHDLPKKGDFNFDIHVANCQHVDLCDTCGKPEGTKGDHTLLQVSPVAEENEITNANYKKAWVEILKHVESIPGLKDAVVVKETISVETWATDWSILKATCHEGEDGYVVKICPGELDKILANLDTEGKAWNDGIDWVKNAEGTVGNYAVDKTAQPEHDYELRYFHLDGTLIGTAANWSEFNEIICSQGYYTQEVCKAKCRDGVTECGHVNPATDGKPGTGQKADYYHEPAGHTLAPVKNYTRFTEHYERATSDTNAKMLQVCVICGETFTERYGATTPEDGSGRDQYNIAMPDQIENWNDHVAAHPEAELFEAQEVLPSDIASANAAQDATVEDNGSLFGNGRTFYTSSKSVTLKGVGKIPATADTAGKVAYESAVTVAKNATLTFAKDSSASRDAQIKVEGTLAFVGEDKATSKVDFSALKRVAVDGGTLILRNITVDLGTEAASSFFNPRTGGKIELDNVVVTVKGSVFAMNAHDTTGKNEVVITDSTLISTADNDFALTVWKQNVEVTAKNSVFFGKQGGAFIRSGSADFTDCTFLTADDVTPNITWQDGSLIGAHAALVVGNKDAQADYGNANVTLTNCKFGVTTLDAVQSGTFTPTACSSDNLAIDAYSNATNETDVSLDAQSFINTDGQIKKTEVKKQVEGKDVSTLKFAYPAPTAQDLGKDATEQQANAAKLVKSLATAGGVVTIPAGLSFTVGKDDSTPLVIAEGTEAELKINAGSTVDLAKGLNVQGKLTVGGAGTLNVQKRGDKNTGVLVSGANAELNIVSGQITVTEDTAKSVNGATYAIYANDNAKVNVSNSLIYSSTGMTLGTNADDANSATFVLINSAFVNDTKAATAQTDGGEFAALINNKNAEIYAGGCTFYGANGAVWVRAAKTAVFAGCTFISGGVTSTQTAFGNGTNLPNTVLAAVVVGNGAGEAYGAVSATIIDGSVYFSNVTTSKNMPTKQAGFADVYTWEENSLKKGEGKADVWTYAPSNTREAVANSTLFSVVAFNSTKTEVIFSDLETAQAFIGAATLTKGTNAFFYGTADRSSFDVKYDSTPEADEPTYLPIGIEGVVEKGEKATVENAAKTEIADVVAHGGTVTLPKQDSGKTAEVAIDDKALSVEKDTVINLNGNKLTVESGINVADKATLTVDGGDVVAEISANETSNVSLNDVNLSGGIMLSYPDGEIAEASTAQISITGSTVTGTDENSTPLYVNGDVDNAKVTLTDSVFLSNDGLGLWIAGKTTVVATDCLFYGSVAAVQVCSGTATFENCTFLTTSGDKWTKDGAEVTWLGSGSAAFPKETRANLVINAKGGGYDVPVKVTVKGANTQFAVADEASNFAPSNVLKAEEADTTRTTKLAHFNYYYKAATQVTLPEISVAVVSAEASTATTALVELTLTDVNVAFKLGKNVFVYKTLGDESSKTAADEDTSVALAQVKTLITGIANLEARGE